MQNIDGQFLLREQLLQPGVVLLAGVLLQPAIPGHLSDLQFLDDLDHRPTVVALFLSLANLRDDLDPGYICVLCL